MDLQVKIKMNDKLFIRDPRESELGRKILQYGIILIHKIGYEAFTFKKLAIEIQTTEAGIYRYFENKHKLLLYIVDWYWSWLEYRLLFETYNVKNPETKLKTAIQLLLAQENERETSTNFMNEKLIHEIVVYEGAKVYLTRSVSEDNKDKLFKPYKDLCGKISEIIQEVNKEYKYPRSLATTIIEMSHSLKFYQANLPSLTDFDQNKGDEKIRDLLEEIVFSSIRK